MGAKRTIPVPELVRACQQRLGSASEIIAALTKLGVLGPKERPYSENSVYNWTSGVSMPPADVILGLAVLVAEKDESFSLDEWLGIRSSLPERILRLEAEHEQLYQQVQAMVAGRRRKISDTKPDLQAFQERRQEA